jgi:hypothetical protein
MPGDDVIPIEFLPFEFVGLQLQTDPIHYLGFLLPDSLQLIFITRDDIVELGIFMYSAMCSNPS